jgi:dihydrofolate reductase
MSRVTCEISMSLDGFITGPNVRVGDGMGDDGDPPRLEVRREDRDRCRDRGRDLCLDGVGRDREADVRRRVRAVGRPPPFEMRVFIVTHEERAPLPMQGGTTYTFVTDGIEAALELARAAAGDKDVGIWGGANIIREYLRAGSLDEMQLHLIPVLFGGGTPLFEDLGPGRIELRRTSSIETPGATHLRFEVVRQGLFRTAVGD